MSDRKSFLPQMGGWLLSAGTAVVLSLGLVLGLPAAGKAQVVQRSFINLDFEDTPYSSAGPCVINFLQSFMPGWKTSHPSRQGTGDCGPAANVGAQGPIFEVWRNGGFSGGLVYSHNGSSMHIELNAAEPSRVSQSVCLVPNEIIPIPLPIAIGVVMATTAGLLF